MIREGVWASSVGMLLAANGVMALEDPSTMQSAAEAAAVIAPGPWQGNWRVTRVDPRLTTRAGSELLVLAVIQNKGASRADVSWQAGRAICGDPLAEPCEFVGATGDAATAAISAGDLVAVLRLSPDDADPYLLHLAAPTTNRPAQGVLLNARGDWTYRIEAERAR